MSTDYEPTKEQVEALAKEGDALSWMDFCRFVLRRQHEREHGLLLALRTISENGAPASGTRARMALESHAALDAPKVPTLLEAAKAAVGCHEFKHGETIEAIAVPAQKWSALKAAVERAEKDAKKR